MASKIRVAIEDGNAPLVALSEISEDLRRVQFEGNIPRLLNAERNARNSGTHRFTVLQDVKGKTSLNPAIEHYDLKEFEKLSIRTTQLARAALLHLLEAISQIELTKYKEGSLVAQIDVYPHHWIRGEG